MTDCQKDHLRKCHDHWRWAIESRGKRYEDCRLRSFSATSAEQEKAIEQLTAFCESPEAENLILYGPVGTGKDHLLFSALHHFAFGRLQVISWVNGLEIFGQYRDGIRDETSERDLLREYQKPDILAISDPLPPSGALTDHQAGWLYRIIDRRYSDMKPTWLTINAKDGKEVESRIGVATTDRIRHNATVIKCNWASYRMAKP